MTNEISSFGYACMLSQIFFTRAAPLGPGLATPLGVSHNGVTTWNAVTLQSCKEKNALRKGDITRGNFLFQLAT